MQKGQQEEEGRKEPGSSTRIGIDWYQEAEEWEQEGDLEAPGLDGQAEKEEEEIELLRLAKF